MFEFYQGSWSAVVSALDEESCSEAVRETIASRDGYGCVFLSHGTQPAAEEDVKPGGKHALLKKPFTHRAFLEAVRMAESTAGN